MAAWALLSRHAQALSSGKCVQYSSYVRQLPSRVQFTQH